MPMSWDSAVAFHEIFGGIHELFGAIVSKPGRKRKSAMVNRKCKSAMVNRKCKSAKVNRKCKSAMVNRKCKSAMVNIFVCTKFVSSEAAFGRWQTALSRLGAALSRSPPTAEGRLGAS